MIDFFNMTHFALLKSIFLKHY